MCHVLRIRHHRFIVVASWLPRKAVEREHGIIKYAKSVK